MRVKVLCSLFIAVSLAGGTTSAQPAKSTTPSNSADNPTGLAAAMKVIQDTLNSVGQVTYTSHGHDSSNGHDWSNSFSNEASRVTANPGACRINYHYRATRDGNVLMDANAGFLLKDVQKIAVLTWQKYFDQENLMNGHPSWTATVDPPVFVVRVQRPANVENQFVFLDGAMANRVAKALTQAVELCTRNK